MSSDPYSPLPLHSPASAPLRVPEQLGPHTGEPDALSRYERDAAGRVIVDIAMARVEDLFHDFDRMAPYPKKDLDDDFADYIVECVRELGKRDFIVRIRLPKVPDEPIQRRLRGSIDAYFLYRAAASRRELRTALRTSGAVFMAGMLVLALSLLAHRYALTEPSLWPRLLAEGLTVAAWVALWQVLASLLTKVPSTLRDIRRYERISAAPVEFKELPLP